MVKDGKYVGEGRSRRSGYIWADIAMGDTVCMDP